MLYCSRDAEHKSFWVSVESNRSASVAGVFNECSLHIAHNSEVKNADNSTHIKGKLLDQAVIILIASLFIMGNSLKRKTKEFAPYGSKFFPSRAVSFGMENHLYHIW